MGTDPDPFLVHKGPRAEVRFANVHGSPSPAKNEFAALEERDRQRFLKRFEALGLMGRLPKPEQINDLTSIIWEFKIDGWRIATFRCGNTWFLTHVFRPRFTTLPVAAS